MNRCKTFYPLQVDMGRRILDVYPQKLDKDAEFVLTCPMGGVKNYEGKIIEFVSYNFQNGDLVFEVEITKDYEVPNEYYAISEQLSSNHYKSAGWFHTEEAALKEYEKYEFAQICKGGANTYGMTIIHDKKMKEV